MSEEQGGTGSTSADGRSLPARRRSIHDYRRRELRKPQGPAGYVPERTQFTALPANPWDWAPFDRADQAAIKALRDGTATPHQQQRGLGWILFACGLNDDPSRPGGIEGERATARALGKHAAAVEIRRLLELPLIGAADSEQGDR
jgi:hypothetical protein